MRIDTINREIRSDKIKYFLSYEGIKTEVLYFEGVIKHREKLNIRDDIEFIPLLRNHSFLGWSNPLKAYERTKFCIDNLKDEKRNISALMSSIVEYCFYKSPEFSKRGDASRLYDTLVDLMKSDYSLSKKENISFYDNRVDDITSCISDYFLNNYSIKNVDKFIKTQFISFNPDKDKVCLIVDRDKKSLNKKQYYQLLRKCSESNYKLYISNPCFEFWLLLHFNEVFDIDKKLIEDNMKMMDIVNPPHFTETELIKLLPEYEKNNICFKELKERISLALKNEKAFSESLLDLEGNIGSNVGLLIKELLSV
ncbi:MAG: RloB family protein [Pleomorphochaeta sp.]